MAEMQNLMVKENTPKKAMLVNRPYSQEERIKKDEEELKLLLKEQKEGPTDTADDSEEPSSAEERTFKKRWRLKKT